MNRETAIGIGMDLMADKLGVDGSKVIPMFVHMLYDLDDGTIRDSDIYPDQTEECEECDDIAGFIDPVDAIEIYKNRMHAVVNEMGEFIDSEYKDEPEEEPRITRRLKAPTLVTDEWLVEATDGSFSKYIKTVTGNGERLTLKLGLMTYNEGRDVKVVYLRDED